MVSWFFDIYCEYHFIIKLALFDTCFTATTSHGTEKNHIYLLQVDTDPLHRVAMYKRASTKAKSFIGGACV